MASDATTDPSNVAVRSRRTFWWLGSQIRCRQDL